VSTTLSFPGRSAVRDSTPRRELGLFGTVRLGDDRRFWRRMLRLLPLAIGLHLLAVALLLTVRPVPRPVPEEPPKVVFLRALPRAAAPAPSAPATHPRPPKARPRPQPKTLRPPPVLPTAAPSEEPPPGMAEAPEPAGATAASPPGPAGGASGGPRSTGEAPVGLGEITRAPAILFSPRPQYPASARAMGIVGRVVVRVVVDVGGRVEPGSARVLSSVAALDAAAVAAIVQWRFSNSVDRLGRPVRVVLDIPVEFSLR